MRLERRGSLRTDEMATSGARARNPLGRLVPEGPEGAPNASKSVQNGR